MRKVILIVLVLLLVPFASGEGKEKVTGTYLVIGYNPGVSTSGKSSYGGELKITKSKGVYHLKWQLGLSGKQTYTGVGIMHDKILSVAFEGGVASYKVEGKMLKGVWAPRRGGPVGYEICQRK